MPNLSPVILTTLLLIFLLGGLFFLVWLIFRLIRRPLRTASLKSFSGEDKEQIFAETFQTVVTHLQTKERHLASLHREVRRRADFAENLNSRIISSLPSGLIAFEANGNLRLANSFAASLLEINEADEQNYREILKNIPALAAMVEQTLENGAVFRRETVAIPRPEKSPLQLGVTVAPLGGEIHDDQFGAVCLMTDITEVNELREQLTLKQNLASLGEMAAGLTHEFKNSLAAAQSYAQFLESSETDEKRKKAAQSLLGEIRNLSQTVTAFLDFARPQSPDFSSVDLSELIGESLAELETLFSSENITVRIKGRFGAVRGDEQMLRRVFLNLLRNAVEAVSERSGQNEIIIQSEISPDSQKNNWLVITIEDTGKGISAENLPFVFVPFFTTKPHGHGIGLALSHRIVSEHGGSLTAGNSLRGGAVFTLKLPLQSE